MADIGSITGIIGVLKNLKVYTAAAALGCDRGLKKAGLLLQKESQKLVPVDLGNLKASAYTRSEGSGFGTVVYIGYTANYALYVHECVGMVLKGLPRTAPSKGFYWDPQGRAQAKFLEEPFRRLEPDMKKILLDEMKI